MINTLEKHLIKLYLKKILDISLIFLCIILVLNVFEEMSFFKDVDVNFFYPFLMTALNAPSTIFEIFPFIFLISTQFFFFDLINKNELEVLKINGINNLKIIKLLLFYTFALGLMLIFFYYNFSSKLKFLYLDLKNNHSLDDKYLAVVNENGLWIKDEINNKKYIINASMIDKQYLYEVSITEFNIEFELIHIIKSEKIDISNKNWKIFTPIIYKDNESVALKNTIALNTHYDEKKISGLFRNLSSLDILELIKLKADYKSIGYSTKEVESHLYKLLTFPLYLAIMTVVSSIIMFNIKRNKPVIFHVILGIFLSVIIYYFYYLFTMMGQNEKIPLISSILLPLLILTIFIFIGLVRVNEK